jgi:nucleotide-binding universal stress UspA family protein
MAIKKILFCTDFSENSSPARSKAVEFAKAFGAELFIVHVVNSRLLGYPSFENKLPVDLALLERNIQEGAQEELESAAAECRKKVSSVKTLLLTGSPAEEIVRFADDHSVDVIVMGTHGWTGIRHLILGSTAENVVRSARCPVLTVRNPK